MQKKPMNYRMEKDVLYVDIVFPRVKTPILDHVHDQDIYSTDEL